MDMTQSLNCLLQYSAGYYQNLSNNNDNDNDSVLSACSLEFKLRRMRFDDSLFVRFGLPTTYEVSSIALAPFPLDLHHQDSYTYTQTSMFWPSTASITTRPRNQDFGR